MMPDASRTDFDAAGFVARYLQFFGWLSIASMIISPIFFDSLRIDFSCIFLFWAASALKKHSQTARMWVFFVCSLARIGLAIVLFTLLVFGTGNMVLSIGATHVKNPPTWYVALLLVAIGVLFSIPIAVLRTEQARHQFGIRSRLA